MPLNFFSTFSILAMSCGMSVCTIKGRVIKNVFAQKKYLGERIFLYKLFESRDVGICSC